MACCTAPRKGSPTGQDAAPPTSDPALPERVDDGPPPGSRGPDSDAGNETLEAKFAAFAAAMRASFEPADALERQLVDRAIVGAFRLQRAQEKAGLAYIGG